MHISFVNIKLNLIFLKVQGITMVDRSEFLYPRSRYHGQVKPENLVFNANLQEFAQRVGYICNLETSGKLPPEECYHQIKALFQQLERSKKELGIGKEPFQDSSGEANS
ncbi:MAG: hypothetical protein NVS2B14_20680 [Chamaesiphon sp.]